MYAVSAEIWKPVTGYEGLYSVSSSGRVWSDEKTLPHKKSGNRKMKGKMLRATENGCGYKTVSLFKNRNMQSLKVSRLVAEAFLPDYSQKMMVDHINGIKSDNRVENLRMATRAQNKANSRKQKNTMSMYKGVSYDKRSGKWVASIQKDKKTHTLGRFSDEKTAAQRYDEEAINYFGEFGKTNKSLGLYKENN